MAAQTGAPFGSPEIIKAHTEGIRELIFETEATVGSALMQSDGNDSLHKLSRRETALMNAANRTITMLHMLRVSRVADDARGLMQSRPSCSQRAIQHFQQGR